MVIGQAGFCVLPHLGKVVQTTTRHYMSSWVPFLSFGCLKLVCVGLFILLVRVHHLACT